MTAKKVNAKSAKRSLSAFNRDKRDDLILWGRQMSNWFYNMSQSSEFTPDIRRQMNLMRDYWDSISRRQP